MSAGRENAPVILLAPKKILLPTVESTVSVIVVKLGLFAICKLPKTDFNAGNETEVSAANVSAMKNPNALTNVGNEIAATFGEV